MKRIPILTISILIILASLPGCTSQTTDSNRVATDNKANSPPVASTSPSPAPDFKETQITLPILNALLSNREFVGQLKTDLRLSDDQIESLKRVAASEIDQLRRSNAEESAGDAAEARNRAAEQISAIIGDDQAKRLSQLAGGFWAKADEVDQGTELSKASEAPNAIPSDTRVVVNIPAFRMDLFQSGQLVKTYKIGIGYPQFPLPQGLRKAQTIIFNPTWTPPDSPWVANMKDVTPGEEVAAGSKQNPLGPIKIPIGMPSLIHGGKSVAKIGKFASHGCVGMTNAQVKDFAKLLAEASQTELSDQSMGNYLQDRSRTRVVKLKQTIPVELRYETIVVEDGKLHIYKDVYNEGSNTEEKLRGVLAAHGVQLENLSEAERTQIMSALTAMSVNPKKAGTTEKTAKPKKSETEVVLELSGLSQGYPSPVNLDDGKNKPMKTVAVREER
jgi:lipoprotein-anchoring transpeptidase ErfK/SrfK